MSGTLWKKWGNYLPGVWHEGESGWRGEDGERGRGVGGLPLFISPSGVQGGVTQCDGCSPDPQTPADTFNGHRFLSRQKEKKREEDRAWSEGDRGGGMDFDRERGEGWRKKYREKAKGLKRKSSEGKTKMSDSSGPAWDAFLDHCSFHLGHVSTCPGRETVEFPPLFFHRICSSQVTI